MRVLRVALIGVILFPLIANSKEVALPEQILQAKTVYIVNQTKKANLGENAVNELTKWGRLKVVQKPDDADLILIVSIQSETVSADSEGDGGDTGGFPDLGEVHLSGKINFACISIYDRQSEKQLWSQNKQLRFFVRNPVGSLVKELRNEVKRQESPRMPSRRI